MAWPSNDLTYANVDGTGDDPGAARVEILAAIQKVTALIEAYNVANGVCPLDASGQVPAANLANATVPDATTSVKGKVELATATEANALSDPNRVITPATLPIGGTAQKGLVELATDSEANTATSDLVVLTPGNLGYYMAQKTPWSVANGGTGSALTPTASNSPQADNIKAVKQDQGHNNVGSLCFATRFNSTTAVTVGSTLAGSALKPCGITIYYSEGAPASPYLNISIGASAALSGTWRCLGYYPGTSDYQTAATLWQRIS